MKVLLVRYHDQEINPRLPPSMSEIRGEVPPLGLAYIAAVFEDNGVAIKILDVKTLNLSQEEYRKILIDESPDVVGITTMTSTVRGALEAAKIAKKSTSAFVVVGGPHIAAYPRETISYDFIDYGIFGEGEYTFLELIAAIDEKEKVDNIPGLVYKKNAQVFVNDPGIIKDLDKLPFPAYHLLPMKNYSNIIESDETISSMITSRGCPHRCGFCFKQPQDKNIRFRKPVNIVDEIEYLKNNFNITEIMFYDDNLTLKKGHVLSICDEILRRNIKIKWESPSRINTVDYDILKKMKEAGCIRLRFGVESGDPDILRLMRKDISLKKVKEVFGDCRKVGIESFAYFIIGYANETEESIKKTISLAKELDASSVMFNVAVPYPHTDLYRRAIEQGLFKGDYWADFTLGKRDDPLPYFVPNADKWVKKAYRSFYLRPNYILSNFKNINSIDRFYSRLKVLKTLLFAR